MKGNWKILIWIPLALTGCFGSKPFQPNPYEYEEWSKHGASIVDVRKTMLECGYPSPFGVGGESVDMVALMHLCMKGQGYVYDRGRFEFCKGLRQKPPACQAGTVSPEPDKEKRLNGSFCKRYPKAPECQL